MSRIVSEETVATDVEWRMRARNLVKAELKRKGVSYRDLAQRLEGMGIHDTDRNISNKLSRGTFTAVFMLQVLAAIGVTELKLS